jgi:hypothetical protein
MVELRWWTEHCYSEYGLAWIDALLWKEKMNLYMYSGCVGFPTGAPTLLDIAVCLSRECRYAGNGVHWWSVALHTFVVCDLLPMELRLHGLLHDAAECVTGDIPKPVKSKAISKMEKEIQAAIYARLKLKLPTLKEQKQIHEADRFALHGEVHTVGTRALRGLYPRHSRAEELVEFYRSCFSPMDCIESDGSCVREFLYRYERYRRSQ